MALNPNGAATETIECTLQDVMNLETSLADRHRRIREELAKLDADPDVVLALQKYPNGVVALQHQYIHECYQNELENIDEQLYQLRQLFKDNPRDLRSVLKINS